MSIRSANWIHIEFWFDFEEIAQNKTRRYAKTFRNLLNLIYCRVFEKINRAFFLYEPNPHCFLALELKNKAYIKNVREEIRKIQKLYADEMGYIKKIKINTDSRDEENGEGFLYIMDAITKYLFCFEDNSLSHITHCICNSFGMSRPKEVMFHKLMAKVYQ